MRGAPMFEKKDTLPRTELHSSIYNWNGLACPSKHHTDVRWHIVGTFRVVFEIIGILRDQPIEKFLQIASCRRIRILHHDQAATGVLRKNRDDAILNFTVAHDDFDFIGDLVSALARSGDAKVSGDDAHVLIFAGYRCGQMTKHEGRRTPE